MFLFRIEFCNYVFSSLYKSQREKNLCQMFLNSDLKNCSLVQIWMKSEIGKVLGNLIMNGGSDCVDHLIG